MNKLKQINEEYEALKKESSNEMNNYFENHREQDFANEIAKLPTWKQIEIEYEDKETEFIKIAKQFGRKNELKDKELVIKISNEILKDPNSINHFLLIRLMWDVGKEEGSFCLETLGKIIRNLLDSGKIGHQEEYYLESLIDIWHYDTDELIPIDILQKIILLDSEELRNRYGAMIKAVSYLSDHPKSEVEKVLSKARETKKYKEDEYYQEWID